MNDEIELVSFLTFLLQEKKLLHNDIVKAVLWLQQKSPQPLSHCLQENLITSEQAVKILFKQMKENKSFMFALKSELGDELYQKIELELAQKTPSLSVALEQLEILKTDEWHRYKELFLKNNFKSEPSEATKDNIINAAALESLKELVNKGGVDHSVLLELDKKNEIQVDAGTVVNSAALESLKELVSNGTID